MPIENTTSSSEATCSLPCSTSLAKLGNWLRKTAPKNHIHEMPSSERNTARLPCASFRLRQVSLTGFQLIDQARIGRRASAGIACAVAATQQRQHHAGDRHRRCGPTLGSATSRPPATLPEQDGDEGAHLHHAVAAGELALVQQLRQVGELDRAEQRRVQPHQEHAAQQHRHVDARRSPRRPAP